MKKTITGCVSNAENKFMITTSVAENPHVSTRRISLVLDITPTAVFWSARSLDLTKCNFFCGILSKTKFTRQKRQQRKT